MTMHLGNSRCVLQRGRKPLALGAASLMSLILMTSCSSGGAAKPASQGQPVSQGQSTPSAAPITVGFVCSCTGPFGSTLVPAEDVYKAWVATVNAAGGLEGHRLKVTYDDDQGNPGVSITKVQSLIGAHVDVIVDNSIVGQTWASAVQKAKIPVVGSNDSETMYDSNPDFFPAGGTINSAFYALIATAKQAKAKNLGAFYCTESPECSQLVAPLSTNGKQLGVPLIYHAAIAATAPNYTAQCVAAKDANVSAVFIGDSPQIMARVGSDCLNQGYKPTYIIEGEAFSNVLLTAPGIKQNLWMEYSTVPPWASLPAVTAMNSAVDKSFPGIRNNPNTWTGQASQAWASGILLSDAVKAGRLGPSATPSAAEITQGLYSLKGDTLQGMSPPLTFHPGKNNGVPCWFTAKVINGVPSLANAGSTTCQPVPPSGA